MNTETRLQLKNLCKSFGKRRVLNNVALALGAGEVILLCGPNGAGKSTLLRILAGLEKPDRAELSVSDTDLLSWRHCKQRLLEQTIYLHQHPYMFDGSVRYNLAYALPRKLDAQARRERIDQALAWGGIAHLQDNPSKNLSGGERQRVSLARAWLRQPRILFLDEPTANLDQASRQRTLDLLTPLKASGMSMVIASHDAHHFAPLADRTLYLHERQLIEAQPILNSRILPGEPDLSVRIPA
ncbi:MAG: ABC transporter ATP-binding protein [Candidatus Thiodiazotropha sp.]